MGKPVAGDVVVLPFPQTNLRAGKRRPALLLVDLPGDDLILCQITSRARGDSHSVAIESNDFDQGQLAVQSFVRTNRLFTVEKSMILYTAARLKGSKLEEILTKTRQLFS
ncbi:MAG TPA: type II toxin-antitoxin system PemK/MazF family toxin [Lacipirellulaceae bacterium]